MLKIYGVSDDLIEIERIIGNETKFEQELDVWDSVTHITFSDGTRIKITYGKVINGVEEGIWKIEVVNEGSAEYRLTSCADPEADIYSDVIYIDAEIVKKRIQNMPRFCRQ